MSTNEQVPPNYEDNADYPVYQKFRSPANPYTLYNNQDRFLNLAYRYQTTGAFQTAWNLHHNEALAATSPAYKLDNAVFETATNTMSQYYWMQMGWLGLGYSLMTNMGTVGPSRNLDNEKSRRALSDAESMVGILRSGINAANETFLYCANAYRYEYEKKATRRNALPADSLAANAPAIDTRTLARARMGLFGSTVFSLNAIVGVVMTAKKLSAIDDEDQSALSADQKKALAAQRDSTIISLGAISANTLANSAKAVSANYMRVALLRAAEPFQVNARLLKDAMVPPTNAQAAFSDELSEVIFENEAAQLYAEAQKAQRRALGLAEVQRQRAAFDEGTEVKGLKAKSVKAAWAGSALGLANGILNIASLLPILMSDDRNLTDRDKEFIGMEMGMQTGAGVLHAASNYALARLLSAPASAGARSIALPGFGIFAAGVLGSLSAIEIYGLIRQSEYASKLAELGERTSQYGYFGDTLLSELYGDKVHTEKWLLVGTTLVSAVGALTEIACLFAGVTGGASVALGLVLAAGSLILKGVQQDLIEEIANDYIRKIKQQGGSYSYFSSNMSATFIQYFDTPEMRAYLADLQSRYGVDSVVGISSTKITTQALELAAYTKYAAQLRTAESQLYRFVNGEMQIDDTIFLSDELGLIDLRNAKPSETKKGQLIKFLSPLMAPGEEDRTRVKTGKHAYYTNLDIAVAGGGWHIMDGELNSVFDVQNVVTQLSNNEDKTILNVTLRIDGGAGDDAVIAGVGKTDFRGGSGFDTISYQSIVGLDVGISVKAVDVNLTDGEFTVIKRSSLAPIYQESTGVEGFAYGKRTETVEFRELRLTRRAFSETDHLYDIENIRGSIGNDDLSGNAAINYFQGEGGNDIIRGMAGADVLSGGAGSDTLDGGAGGDTADYSDDADRMAGIIAQLESPTQPAYLQYVNGLPAVYGTVHEQWQPRGVLRPIITDDQLVSIENLIGTKFSDTISGSAGDNYLSGAGGGDRLDGLVGNDTLAGGDGEDSVCGGDDEDILDGGDGIDTLDYTEMSYAGMDVVAAIDLEVGVRADLANHTVDKVARGVVIGTDTVSAIENFVGTDFKDVIAGSASAESLSGGHGNDDLSGADGDDVLYGDFDDDTLNGGAGHDTLYGSVGSDLLNGSAGDDAIVQSYLLGYDKIDGGDGADRVDYGRQAAPDDSACIIADLASGTVHKFAADMLLGVDTLVNVEALIGTLFNDTISGNAVANLLDGEDGDDVLAGGGGNDTLIGGLGNDRYRFTGESGDVTLRDMGGGYDVIEISDITTKDYSAVRLDQDLKIWRTDASNGVITIADWYSGSGFRIEELRIGNTRVYGADLNLLVETSPKSLASISREML